MKVLLSIKPEYASKIFEGSKKYEFRRNIFKRDTESVVVYASAPVSRVIGEFEIEHILHENIESLWAKTKKYAGISRDGFLEYFTSKDEGYAIRVKNSVLYEEAVQLATLNIQTAPQSFLYLPEE
jgi:predicted transcriptional regulator